MDKWLTIKYNVKLGKIYIKLIIKRGHQVLTKDWQGIWLSYTKREFIPQATDPNKTRVLKDVSPAKRDIKR